MEARCGASAMSTSDLQNAVPHYVTYRSNPVCRLCKIFVRHRRSSIPPGQSDSCGFTWADVGCSHRLRRVGQRPAVLSSNMRRPRSRRSGSAGQLRNRGRKPVRQTRCCQHEGARMNCRQTSSVGSRRTFSGPLKSVAFSPNYRRCLWPFAAHRGAGHAVTRHQPGSQWYVGRCRHRHFEGHPDGERLKELATFSAGASYRINGNIAGFGEIT